MMDEAMIASDDAMEVRFGVRLLGRAAHHASIYIYIYVLLLLRTCKCGTCGAGQLVSWSNNLKDRSVK